LWVEREYELFRRQGTAVVFAPENVLAPLWQAATQLQIVKIDSEPTRQPDLLRDLLRLPIATGTADLIWCHHVLEHIEDDRRAISELFRILRPEHGQLIVSVPMYDGESTNEFGFADQNLSGHWRIYGSDFADRLAATGFTVRCAMPKLSQREQAYYRIDPEKFFLCTKDAACESRMKCDES
jgi:SAM-dependent methyltransferase